MTQKSSYCVIGGILPPCVKTTRSISGCLGLEFIMSSLASSMASSRPRPRPPFFRSWSAEEKLAKTMTETVSLATVGLRRHQFLFYWIPILMDTGLTNIQTRNSERLRAPAPAQAATEVFRFSGWTGGRGGRQTTLSRFPLLMWGELIRRSTLTWEAYSGCKFTKSAVEPLSTLMDCSSISSGWTF